MELRTENAKNIWKFSLSIWAERRHIHKIWIDSIASYQEAMCILNEFSSRVRSYISEDLEACRVLKRYYSTVFCISDKLYGLLLNRTNRSV